VEEHVTTVRRNTILSLCLSSAAAVVFGSLVLAGGTTDDELEIISEPAGASLFVNGVFRGVTPLTIEDLSPGRHAVRLEKMGFDPLTGTIANEGGRVGPRTFRLAPASRGSIQVTSKPAGCEVFIGAEFRGVTPLTMHGIAAGEHVLRAEKTNHNPWTDSVSVESGKTTVAHCELEDRVLAFLHRTIAEEPRNLLARVELGHYYMVLGEAEKAAEVYLAAREEAKDARVLKKSVNRLEKQIRKDMMWKGPAGERFRAAMRPPKPPAGDSLRDPDRALRLAAKQEKANLPSAGAQILERALTFNPNHPQLLEQRARLRIVAGDRARAIGALHEAFKRTGRDLQVRMRLGNACLAYADKFDEARRTAMSGLCADQLASARTAAGRAEDVESGRLLARLCAGAGRGDEAVATYERCVRRERNSTARAQIELELGALLGTLGRTADARALLEKLAAEAPTQGIRHAARIALSKLARRSTP
jgi:tetratricopeptide (TPR) repeat protein